MSNSSQRLRIVSCVSEMDATDEGGVYSRAVRLSSRARSSGMTFQVAFGVEQRCASSMRLPRTNISPLQAANRPVSILIVVDFPAKAVRVPGTHRTSRGLTASLDAASRHRKLPKYLASAFALSDEERARKTKGGGGSAVCGAVE